MSENNKDEEILDLTGKAKVVGKTLVFKDGATVVGNTVVIKGDNDKSVTVPGVKIAVDGETIIFSDSGVEVKDGILIFH